MLGSTTISGRTGRVNSLGDVRVRSGETTRRKRCHRQWNPTGRATARTYDPEARRYLRGLGERLIGSSGIDATPRSTRLVSTSSDQSKSADEPTVRHLLVVSEEESQSVYTDRFPTYDPLEEDDQFHREYVVHSNSEYADDEVHINTWRVTDRSSDRGSRPIEASQRTS